MKAPAHVVLPVTDQGNWITAIACVGLEVVCCNTSAAKQLSFHDATTLQTTFHLSPHTANVTDVQLCGDGGALVLSSGRDGVVHSYDRRANARGPLLRCSGENPVLSCAVNGPLVAAAEGTSVWFFDLRTGRPLRRFDESHSEEVSMVRFASGPAGTLLSAGADGLVCVYNTAEVDESDALLDVLNEGASIDRVGLTDAQHAWVTTDMGGVSVWSLETAERTWTHPRLAQHVGAQWALGCHAGGLISCGHTEGNVSVVRADTGAVECIFQGGHTAAVRACAQSPASGRWLTGAEDGRLIVWGDEPFQGGDEQNIGPVRRHGRAI